ncbi:MAG: hypothetical protein CMM87_05360 [Rickettsiales bacterium]|nr:hypothetical protein [Rickettsiales bacterium]
MAATRLHLRNRRRSQHNCRPPPGPVTIMLCRAPKFELDAKQLHAPSRACVLATTQHLSSNLFCSFARWATIVHRPAPPATVVQAAKCLGHLCWPTEAISFTCDISQLHAFAFGKHLRLNTKLLRPSELRDLRWLAHATTAWQTSEVARDAQRHTLRNAFLFNDVFREAHESMLMRDKNTWGGLIPQQLVPMLLHACGKLKQGKVDNADAGTNNSQNEGAATGDNSSFCRC